MAIAKKGYKMDLISVLVGIAVGIVIMVPVWIYKRFPIPINEKGHRLFGIAGPEARDAVEEIWKLNGFGRIDFAPGVSEAELGPTNQILLGDGFTVLCYFDESVPKEEQNAPSIPCKDPEKSAQQAAALLKSCGFTAEIAMPMGHKIPFYKVSSNAFVNNVMGFRLPVMKMPKIPKTK